MQLEGPRLCNVIVFLANEALKMVTWSACKVFADSSIRNG